MAKKKKKKEKEVTHNHTNNKGSWVDFPICD